MIKFSIIIPTFNRANLIIETLKSVLNQTYRNFEVIIVDDGSTDNTEDIIKPFLNESVFYFKKENEERAAARNFGTNKAKGEYLNWFDSDDIMLPNHLQTAFDFIKKQNNPEIFALGYEIRNSKRIFFTSKYDGIMNHKIYRGNIFACNPVFVRSDIAQSNLFNENRQLSGSEDYELWLRLASKFNFYTTNIITSYLVQHDNRSVLTMRTPSKLENRFLLFLEITCGNENISKLLGNKNNYFSMKNYFLISVDLAAVGYKKKSFFYLKKGMQNSFYFLFDKSFYAIIKHLIFAKTKK